MTDGRENPCAAASPEIAMLIVRMQTELERMRSDMDDALVDIKTLLALANRARGFAAALMLLAGALGGVAGAIVGAWPGP